MPKLFCPKCKNDSFKISLSERQEVYSGGAKLVTREPITATRRIRIITILNITCSKCGWNTHYRKA